MIKRTLAFSSTAVAQVRIARPTNQLENIVAFYRDGLGLLERERFENHAGYSGVMLGLPEVTCHLEFTQHVAAGPLPAPSADNLLVLYVPDAVQLSSLRQRLERLGHKPVEPENPYWSQRAVTFEDPDGWRVVLHHSAGI
jgi:catechol 2,3-dioxygenase-like lactoylglutathione lyase family enzyme